jgi:hypothetical protein
MNNLTHTNHKKGHTMATSVYFWWNFEHEFSFCCTHENLANYFKFSQKSNLKVTKGVLEVGIWLTFF